jgi:hypothetical protein
MDEHQNPEEAAESGKDNLRASVDNLKEAASAKVEDKSRKIGSNSSMTTANIIAVPEEVELLKRSEPLQEQSGRVHIQFVSRANQKEHREKRRYRDFQP